MNAEVFLQKYRILEGLLEKRYDGEKMSSSSVVMEYIRDPDSESVRVDLDLIREIRNLLSHNAASDGEAVVQPSAAMIARLDEIIEHVKRVLPAKDFGTPAGRILFAHPNDNVLSVMRSMQKNGYSHVPVMEKGSLKGIFSIKCLFDYLATKGFSALDASARIRDLGDHISIDGRRGERYMFVPANTSIISVRAAFRSYKERDRRLRAVFVTQSGSPQEEIICMLSPWDVLSDQKQ